MAYCLMAKDYVQDSILHSVVEIKTAPPAALLHALFFPSLLECFPKVFIHLLQNVPVSPSDSLPRAVCVLRSVVYKWMRKEKNHCRAGRQFTWLWDFLGFAGEKVELSHSLSLCYSGSAGFLHDNDFQPNPLFAAVSGNSLKILAFYVSLILLVQLSSRFFFGLLIHGDLN